MCGNPFAGPRLPSVPPAPSRAAEPPTPADLSVRQAGERERLRARLAGVGQTMLTGPLGLTTTAPGTPKTLLGA